MTDRIVVGIDGSQSSRAALRWAAGEARAHQASITVITAYRLPLAFAGTSADPASVAPDEQQRAEAIQAEMLAEAESVLEGLEVTTVIRAGEGPGHAVVAAAEGADLLVVGAFGLGGISGFTIGSVSHYCVGHATCPVVVVPAGR
jgi:nucleotide-binding universal stress UspA family protein